MSAWPIPQLYAGQTVAIIAGGPSATPAAIASVSQYQRIAVREAYRLAPDAEVLLSLDGDDEWFARTRAHGATGMMLSGNPDIEGSRVHYIGLRYERFFNGPQNEVEIRNSGLAAIRVAAEMGAARILTVGIDLERHGYADGYTPGVQKAGAEPYTNAQAGLAALVAELAAKGITVERAPRVRTPKSEEPPAPAEAATEESERPARRRIIPNRLLPTPSE